MDIVGIGYPVMDCLVRMNRLPKTDGASDLLESSWQGGGMIATGLVAAAVLGAQCGMLGVVGGDGYGQFCLEDLQRNGVDTSRLAVDQKESTFLTFVLSETEKGGRSFVGKPGTHRKLRPDELDESYIGGAEYLFLSSMDEIDVAACRIARKHGVRVFVDADVYDEAILRHLDLIDALVASEDFYKGRFQDESYEANCRTLQRCGPEIVVVTLGARGMRGVYRDEYLALNAFKVAVRDTTGAGDVFHGAFLYGMLQGWPGERVARFASAVSAIKCTRLGGRAGIPDTKTAERFCETGEIDYAEINKRVLMYQNGRMRA
ncbi:MAG: carbohydrate kinase family protein [Clostridia bacterium]